MDDATLVVFGANGDMARRLLFPALYELEQLKRLEKLKIVAYARKDWSRAQYIELIHEGISSLSGLTTSKTVWQRFARRIDYVKGDIDPRELRLLAPKLKGNAAFYLALPPDLFAPAATALAEAGLADESAGWRRIVIEKPFGTDLESALELNEKLHKHWEEKQLFRIDHFLGKETVQNILVFRFANRFLDPVFNCQHVEYVEITAAETLGLEGRVSFYDGVGALRDMLQSHLIQLLALIAMEPLTRWDNDVLHNHKVEALRSVRAIEPEDVPHHAVRGQYTASRRGGHSGRGYLQEKDIPADSRTETFAALKLYFDNWRWQGTPFYLRSGKRLKSDLTEVAIHFREPPFRVAGDKHGQETNQLVFRLRPHESINIGVQVRKPGFEMATEGLNLHADYPETSTSSSSAYRQLILDLIDGEQTAFVRFDEVEWAWRIIDPIVKAWQKGNPDPYPSGSEGPDCQHRVIAHGHEWRSLSEEPIISHDR